MIRIETTSTAHLLEHWQHDAPALVHADPPWEYGNGTRKKDGRKRLNGVQGNHYGGLSLKEISGDIAASHRIAPDDCYLVLWVTFPFLILWAETTFRMGKRWPWSHVSGGTWGKINGRGVGYHFIGDSELLLLYRKGRPRPIGKVRSNYWPTDVEAPHWGEKRGSHSEKPAAVLSDLVTMSTHPGELVLDLYAGQSASLARVCALKGRRYVGAEIDPDRAEKARDSVASLVEAIA